MLLFVFYFYFIYICLGRGFFEVFFWFYFRFYNSNGFMFFNIVRVGGSNLKWFLSSVFGGVVFLVYIKKLGVS